MSFRRNPAFIEELRRDPEVREAIADRAAEVRDLALAFSRKRGKPIMPRKGRRKSFVVARAGEHDIYVVNTDHGGAIEEWGSKNSRKYAPLRRAVRAAGLPLVEHHKP